jgi:hypothetical protein
MNERANVFREMEAVISLLRTEVERAGSQAAWAKRRSPDHRQLHSPGTQNANQEDHRCSESAYGFCVEAKIAALSWVP